MLLKRLTMSCLSTGSCAASLTDGKDRDHYREKKIWICFCLIKTLLTAPFWRLYFPRIETKQKAHKSFKLNASNPIQSNSNPIEGVSKNLLDNTPTLSSSVENTANWKLSNNAEKIFYFFTQSLDEVLGLNKSLSLWKSKYTRILQTNFAKKPTQVFYLPIFIYF